MPPTTSADTQFEDKIRTELSKVRDASRCKRVEITKGIFNLILTTSGITYVNKHPKFKKTLRLKLEDFYWEPEVKTHVIEWHMTIFKEPIWQIRQRYWERLGRREYIREAKAKSKAVKRTTT